MVTINGTEYNGMLVDMGKSVGVTIFDEISLEECARFGNTPSLSDGTQTITTASRLARIERTSEGYVNCEWLCQTDAEKIAEELEHTKTELAESEAEKEELGNRIKHVREAIITLGTGIPTLSKLLTFLSAVKEAIHYDGSDNDD